jgi:thiol:disulfide interchange protein DsbD
MKFILSKRGQPGMILILASVFAVAPMLALATGPNGEHVAVTLLSEQSALAPGTTAWLGIRLVHGPHWHTYWVNPGDSGLPTRLTWQLPQGYRGGEIAWPAPQRIAVGDLYNFGYEGETLLPVPIDVPADAKIGGSAHIAVDVKWLVCQEECIPGKASLAIDVPVRSESARDARNAKLFDAARAAQPQPASWQGAAQVRDDSVEVTLHVANLPAKLDAFVAQRKLVNYAPPQTTRNGADVTLVFPKSDYFSAAPDRLDLVVRSEAHAWSVRVPIDAASLPSSP